MSEFERKPIEVLSGAVVASAPPQKHWVIEGIIPGGVTVLYGDNSAGKSFLALSMSACVATGQPFLGRPVTPGLVVYLSLEGDIEPAWYLWKRHHGILVSPQQHRDVRDQFHSAEDYERDSDDEDDLYERRYDEKREADEKEYRRALCRLPSGRLGIIKDHAVSLANEGDIKRVAAAIEAFRRQFPSDVDTTIRLIVVDTLSRGNRGDVDENSTPGMQKLLRGVEDLRRLVYQRHPPEALVLHHATKGTDKARGGNSFVDDLDASLYLKIANKNCKAYDAVVPLKLESKKMRSGQGFRELRLVKREFPLVLPADEPEALAEKNRLRERTGEQPLTALQPTTSCLIELDDAATNTEAATASSPQVEPPARRRRAQESNIEKLTTTLRTHDGRAEERVVRAESQIKPGSWHAAKEKARIEGRIKIEDGYLVLTEAA